MNINSKNPQRKKQYKLEALKLINQSRILDQSLKWWESEMQKSFVKMDYLENHSFVVDHKKRKQLEDRINYLVKKGDFERKQIDLFHKNLSEFTQKWKTMPILNKKEE
ncbi:MAG: hypothetical protein AABY22_31245 [Nanoarchaeota archaeon]